MLRTPTNNLISEIYKNIISEKWGKKIVKKTVLIVTVCALGLSGCGNKNETNSEKNNSSTTSSISTDSIAQTSSTKSELFEIGSPKYSSDKKRFTIDAEVDPYTSIHVYLEDSRLKSVFSGNSGKAVLELETPAEKQTYTVKTDYASKEIEIESLREYEERQKEKESNQFSSEALEKEIESSSEDYSKTRSTSTESSQLDSSSFKTSESTETTTSSDETVSIQEKITNPSEDQKSLLIAWTQLECEDIGAELSYAGSDAWNVAVNYINGVNRWITTTEDKKYGRIKTIYEWSGEENDGASLIYLLVSGEELINKL